MDSAKPITTRRVIKPGGQAENPAAPPGASPALQRSPPTPPEGSPLWRSWLTRFEELDRALIAADARERNGWQQAPRKGDPAEMSRIQTRFLAPWSALAETFAAAVIASPLSPAQRQAFQGYLDLRSGYYRCLMKRFLVPSDVAMAQLAEAEAKLAAAVAQRQTSR